MDPDKPVNFRFDFPNPYLPDPMALYYGPL